MSVQPAIVTFAGTPPPTTADRDAWWLANLNAALVFERMIGIAPRVEGASGADVLVVQSPLPLLDTQDVNTNPLVWAAVGTALAIAGHNPDHRFYSVVVPTIPGGGGLAQSQPFRGWYAPGLPGDGGLAILGGRHLRSLGSVRRPTAARPWTPSERAVYMTNVWLLVHEWCHVGSVPHWQGDPTLPQFARSTITNYGSLSYWLGRLQPDGSYALMDTIGFVTQELAAIRGSALWDFRPTAEYQRIYLHHDRDYLLRADVNRPVHQIVGAGLAVQEYHP